jgi:hypothetical protein
MCRGTFEEAYVSIHIWKHTINITKPQNIVNDPFIPSVRFLEIIVNINNTNKYKISIEDDSIPTGISLLGIKFPFLDTWACPT